MWMISSPRSKGRETRPQEKYIEMANPRFPLLIGLDNMVKPTGLPRNRLEINYTFRQVDISISSNMGKNLLSSD
jgi:hypothetical protein